MNNKLKKISKKLSGLVSNHKTHQEVYDRLSHIWNQESYYFSILSPEDLLYLVFYVKDYLDNGNFNKSDAIISNLFLTALIMPHNENAYESCQTCDGRGEISCEYCSGSGEDYEDDNCRECNGYGSVECPDCHGHGEVETSKIIFTLFNVTSWDDDFEIKCELSTPDEYLMNENEFYSLKNNDKLLILDISYGSLLSNLAPDLIYCTNITEDIVLYRRPNKKLFYLMESDIEWIYR
jgi:hypothetical protein